MGKSGGGVTPIFDQYVFGPPPGDVTIGNEGWAEIASIPSGQNLWFGAGEYTSPDKSFTFELRTNLVGESQGTLAATKLLFSTAVSPRKGTVRTDMYKNGRLHTVSVIGTGVEKCWLRIKSKSGTQASYLYVVTWTVE